jgi:hypothetical protein
MRNLLASAVVAGSLLLGGCATTGTTTGTDPITGQPIATEIANVQALAVKICAFQPTEATVAAILATLVPGAAPVTAIISQVAASICSAVAAPAARLRGAAWPEVNGVPINGHFVSRGGRHRR